MANSSTDSNFYQKYRKSDIFSSNNNSVRGICTPKRVIILA